METFQFEGKTYEIRLQAPDALCDGCAFQGRNCDSSGIPNRPSCIKPHRIFIEVQQPPAPQPAPNPLARLVPLREKAPGVLEETAHDDQWATSWGVAVRGVPMIRLATRDAALQVVKLAEVAFQSGQQKAFADLADWVEGQR